MNLIKGLLCIFLLCLIGCTEEENTDSVTETGIAISDVGVTCTTATSANCDAASDTKPTYIGWTTLTCASFEGTTSATNLQNIACTAGTCSVANSGDWLNGEDDSIVTTMLAGSTTAIAWLNLTDNGASDDQGPATGDVFCCAEDQSGDATLTDSDCAEIP